MSKHQTETPDKHPKRYESDLNPNAMAGQNIGVPSPADDTVSAYDIKELHELLSDFTADELKRIRVVRAYRRLEQGATYLDLRNRERGEFTVTALFETDRDHLIVPKSHTDYELWNRLRGVHGVKRTGTEG